MHKTKQLIAVAAVVLLMGFLFAQPIKGLVNEDTNTADASGAAANTITLELASQQAKRGLNASLIEEITALESQLDEASGEAKLALLRQLATKWDDVNEPAPKGFVYEEMAKIDPQFTYWLEAGDAYRAAYTNLQDTVAARALNDYAINAYEQALEINPGDLNAKTGLGSAYVSGTNNPMAGISLLREVVDADPDHVGANKSLGLFSMQSRQFDLAIDRFKKVVSLEPDAESYFYLATSYENIGLNREAIAAFEKSRDLAADPTLTQFINRKIDELSK